MSDDMRLTPDREADDQAAEARLAELDAAIVGDARIGAITAALASMAEEIDYLRSELQEARASSLFFENDRERLFAEVASLTAERDRLRGQT